MANTLLTATMVTREALRVLHQKLNFVGTIDRQYDDSFAKSGAKIGDTLKIRLPNQYEVRTGPNLDVKDIDESSVDLLVATQKGVDMTFSSADLTLSLDDFSDRILDPAMSVLAANIEADAMSMFKDVYNEVSDISEGVTLRDVLDMSKKLTDDLAPTSNRTLNLNTADNVALVDELKGLFNDPAKIAKNFREGMVANEFVGFSQVFQNTLWPSFTTGTHAGAGTYLIAGASQTGSTIAVDGGTGTLLKGEIITIDGVNRVHPETKADTGKLQHFVVTADYAGGAGNIAISPAIVTSATSAAKQNVTGSPADNAAVRRRESDETTVIGADTTYNISMGYHKEAFAFATADLEMPKGVDFSAREVFDGISMRVVRQYDINTDHLPTRIDVLYGFKTTRPELACRGGFNS